MSEKTAPQLGSSAIRAALGKVGLPANSVEDVMMGCVLQAGVGQAPARQAALLSGRVVNYPRVCGYQFQLPAGSAGNAGNKEI